MFALHILLNSELSSHILFSNSELARIITESSLQFRAVSSQNPRNMKLRIYTVFNVQQSIIDIFCRTQSFNSLTVFICDVFFNVLNMDSDWKLKLTLKQTLTLSLSKVQGLVDAHSCYTPPAPEKLIWPINIFGGFFFTEEKEHVSSERRINFIFQTTEKWIRSILLKNTFEIFSTR